MGSGDAPAEATLSTGAAVAFEDFAGVSVPQAVAQCSSGQPSARVAAAVVWVTDPDAGSLDDVLARPYPAVVEAAVAAFAGGPDGDQADEVPGVGADGEVDLDDTDLQAQVGQMISQAAAQQAEADSSGGAG